MNNKKRHKIFMMRFKQLIQEIGCSNAAIAVCIAKDENAVSNWHRFGNYPATESFIDLCEILDILPGWLAGATDKFCNFHGGNERDLHLMRKTISEKYHAYTGRNVRWVQFGWVGIHPPSTYNARASNGGVARNIHQRE